MIGRVGSGEVDSRVGIPGHTETGVSVRAPVVGLKHREKPMTKYTDPDPRPVPLKDSSVTANRRSKPQGRTCLETLWDVGSKHSGW